MRRTGPVPQRVNDAAAALVYSPHGKAHMVVGRDGAPDRGGNLCRGYGFVPMHARGEAQTLLGHVNALAFMLAVPGQAVARELAGGFDNRFSPEYHVTASAANGVFYVLLVRLLLGIGAWVCGRSAAPAGATPQAIAEDATTPTGPAEQAASVASASQALSRRDFLLATTRAGAGVALAGVAAGPAWALFVQPRRYEIVRHRLALPDLPTELDGLRIVQLSDIHHGPWLSLDYIARVVTDTNALRPDLVLLTGDYVQGRRHYVSPCVAALAALAPRIGVLAVLGNHDWWEGVDEARGAFGRVGIPLLDNDRRVLTPQRRLARVDEAGGPEARGLAIAGLGDYLEGGPDFAAALDGLPAHMPCLLMSHWPDAAEDPAMRYGRWRVDLMLSGHTHGGQVRLPLVGTPIVPSRYGQKYAAGFVDGPACRVYVNRGIGTALLPVRWGVAPEITVFDLSAV